MIRSAIKEIANIIDAIPVAPAKSYCSSFTTIRSGAISEM
jgi:hypothetical protein